MAIADYLQHDGYDRHLRKVRKGYEQRARMMAAAVLRFFPEGTRVSEPQGGYVLWVEMPPAVDAMKLYALALERKITVGPGHMFSARGSYPNYIRLNYSYPWSRETEDALRMLGKLVAQLA
jgi:DNA-binding transcriptional MocR family regulator